jgi:DNA-binding MarR family transcriptional regulator
LVLDQSRERLIQEIFTDATYVRRKITSHKNIPPDGFGVPPSQGIVLFIMTNNDSLSIKEIAGLMQVSRSAATQFVDALVQDGYLLRKADPNAGTNDFPAVQSSSQNNGA